MQALGILGAGGATGLGLAAVAAGTGYVTGLLAGGLIRVNGPDGGPADPGAALKLTAAGAGALAITGAGVAVTGMLHGTGAKVAGVIGAAALVASGTATMIGGFATGVSLYG